MPPRPARRSTPRSPPESEYYGLYIKYTLSLCGQTVKSIEKNDGTKYFETGEEVSVFIKPDDLMVY